MSIELKPCPFCGSDSITNHDTLIGYSVGCDKCGAVAAYCATEAESISAWNTRTVIQQAEARTDEPVAWLDEILADTKEVFDVNGTETPQVVRDVIEYVASWIAVYNEKRHPAPGVSDDVVRDAERYRWLLKQAWFQQAADRFDFTDGGMLARFEKCMDDFIDAAIDAAQAQKGQP